MYSSPDSTVPQMAQMHLPVAIPLVAALVAGAYVGWLTVVSRCVDPWLRRHVGTFFRVRIDSKLAKVGLSRARGWTTSAVDGTTSGLVALVDAAKTLVVAVAPAVVLAIAVNSAGVPERWSETATLMCFFGSPIGVVAQLFGQAKAPEEPGSA